MRTIGMAVAGGLMLSGCISASEVRYYEYPMTDPYIATVGNKTFRVDHHPNEGTVLIVPSGGSSFGAALVSDLSLGTRDISTTAATPQEYRAAVAAYAERYHCEVGAVYPLNRMNWEAEVRC